MPRIGHGTCEQWRGTKGTKRAGNMVLPSVTRLQQWTLGSDEEVGVWLERNGVQKHRKICCQRHSFSKSSNSASAHHINLHSEPFHCMLAFFLLGKKEERNVGKVLRENQKWVVCIPLVYAKRDWKRQTMNCSFPSREWRAGNCTHQLQNRVQPHVFTS